MIRRNLRTKIILPAVIILSLLVTVMTVYSSNMFLRNTENRVNSSVAAAAKGLSSHLKNSVSITRGAAVETALDRNVLNVIKGQDTWQIIGILNRSLALYNVDYFTVSDQDGNVLARTYQPENKGDYVGNQKNVMNALAGIISTYYEEGTMIKASVRTGAPVYDPDDPNPGKRPIAVISAGIRLDTNEAVDRLKEQFNTDVTIFFGDRRVATTIVKDGERILDTRLDPDVAKIVMSGKEYSGPTDVLGDRYLTHYIPLLDSDNNVYAILATSSSYASLMQEARSVIISNVLIGLAGLVFSIAVLFLIISRTTRPVKDLLNLVLDVTRGEVPDTADKIHVTEDEIGVLILNIYALIGIVKSTLSDISSMTHELHSTGDIEFKIDTSKYSGSYKEIISGIQDLGDSISNMNKTMAVMDFLKTMVTVVDFDYNLLYGNRYLADTYGIDIESCLGRKCYKAVRNLSEPCPFCPMGIIDQNKEDYTVTDYTYNWDECSGKWLGGQAAIIRWTDGSRVLCTFMNDETQIMKYEEQLRETVKELETQTAVLGAVFDSTPDIIYCMDLDLKYMRINKSFKRFFNVDESEFIGKIGGERLNLPEDVKASITDKNKQVLREKTTLMFEEIVKLQDESMIYFQTTITPLWLNEDMIGILGIAHDITEHKQMEDELIAASVAKSAFLANMSHEIRTPMNAIIGMSELLKQEKLTKRQRGFNNDIYESAHSLLSIINDILDFSKIEAGKIELNPVDYDFKALMDNIGSMFTYVADKKGLEFRFECAGEMPQYLFGDDVRLRQVLTNICGNAVKFTDTGYVRLKVTVTDKLMFEIKDTGRGISKEDAPKLFSAFQQADTSKNRNTTGTGLGLVISKSFVEMMGGSISFDSEYGQGTVFIIIIPMVAGDKNRVQHEKTVKEKFTMFAPTANVLVVDDNEFNLRVASGLLNLHKINADTADSGKEGIERIQRKKYDIVFMDHMMPEMDGVETTAAIRKLGEPFTELPIIALTANAVQGAKEMFLANGFNDFISKPIDMQELTAILSVWLPPEKIAGETEAFPEAGEPGMESDEGAGLDFMDFLDTVHEINTDIGLSRVSGMEDMYREAVELFAKKVAGECSHMSAFIEAEDIGGFAIRVHAMKSMLSTIGAMGLFETAARLELAAKNREMEYCAGHYPSYQVELLALHEKLSVIFPDEKDTAKKEPGDAAHLNENLQKALEAARDFDSDACLNALNELLAFDFGDPVNAGLQNAVTAIEEFDFDRVAEVLGVII